MSSSTMIIVLSFIWSLCVISNTLTKNDSNQRFWFADKSQYQIEQPLFRTIFTQYQNVNRHLDWLETEISSLNSEIKSIKDQLVTIIINRNKREKSRETNSKNISFNTNTILKNSIISSSETKPKNQQNLNILKSLQNEMIFDKYHQDLMDIYEASLTPVIECIAVIIQQDSDERYLFIKLSNGIIDKYEMATNKSLKETFSNFNQPLSVWYQTGKQLEYYRRFTSKSKPSEYTNSDQLVEIKNRPKLNDAYFFDMMGQILRIKYHTDPSSHSCILESFFGHIYTCDGRLIFSNELKFLSNNNGLFRFYAIMFDTKTERQIYPIRLNYHVEHGEQIIFLFKNHPQFNMLSPTTCPNCLHQDSAYAFTNNQESLKTTSDSLNPESNRVRSNLEIACMDYSQKLVVYVFVMFIVFYITISIILNRKQMSAKRIPRKPIASPRRGR